jgi:AraC family transcriptional regulator
MAHHSDAAVAIRSLLSRMPPPGQTLAASTSNLAWKNIHGVILDGRVEEFFDYSVPFPIVIFTLRAMTQVEWERGGRYSRFVAKPGDVLVLAPGAGNSLRTNLPNEAFYCLVNPELLESLAERDWKTGGRAIEIMERFTKNDAEMWRLGQCLATQLRSPVTGSRLYAESLYSQIAIQLLWNYSSLPRPGKTQREHLDDQRLRRAVDFIHDALGDDISLDALAEVAGLSPNYFVSAFKDATGRTPHRYITEQRIAKACDLLHDPHRSITDVSGAVGFSSQSHMTEVFRRFMKTTPAAYRREVLGLTS